MASGVWRQCFLSFNVVTNAEFPHPAALKVFKMSPNATKIGLKPGPKWRLLGLLCQLMK